MIPTALKIEWRPRHDGSDGWLDGAHLYSLKVEEKFIVVTNMSNKDVPHTTHSFSRRIPNYFTLKQVQRLCQLDINYHDKGVLDPFISCGNV